MRASSWVVLASTNHHKLEEFQALSQKESFFPIRILNAFTANAGKMCFVEEGKTFLENALLKAQVANRAVHYPVIADDTGLEVEALEGKPGLYSARYGIAPVGQSQDQANQEKLLEALAEVPSEKRQARFVCIIVLQMEGMCLHAMGILEGTILKKMRGERGFGYDSLFVPKGQQRTLAEMSFEEKNAISHRAVAFQALVKSFRKRAMALVHP